MTRVVRLAMGAALAVALCFGARADARFVAVQQPGVWLAHVFHAGDGDTMPTEIAGLAFHLPRSLHRAGTLDASYGAADLVSDAIFDIDVELPFVVRTPAQPVLLASDLHASYATGVVFRLHDERIQLQYQTAGPSYARGVALAVGAGLIPSFTYSGSAPARAARGGTAFEITQPYPGPGVLSVLGGAPAAFAPATPEVLAPRISMPRHIVARFGGTGVLQPDSFAAMQACGTADPNAACPAYSSRQRRQLIAGTTFGVRAGRRRVNVDLSSSYEHLALPDDSAFLYVPINPGAQALDPAQTSGDAQSSIQYYPSLVDVTKRGINANVAVPLSQDLTVSVGYNTQHYQGLDTSTLDPTVDARKNAYLGNITYEFPHTHSAISFSAQQYRYQDTFVPSYNLTQTRADLNFTVKF